MPYKDEYHPAVKKDLKQLDHHVIKDVFDIHIEKLIQNPNIGERLHGDFEGIFSYHFTKNKIEYRIAYTVDEEKLYILRIAKRENFYEILKRRLS